MGTWVRVCEGGGGGGCCKGYWCASRFRCCVVIVLPLLLIVVVFNIIIIIGVVAVAAVDRLSVGVSATGAMVGAPSAVTNVIICQDDGSGGIVVGEHTLLSKTLAGTVPRSTSTGTTIDGCVRSAGTTTLTWSRALNSGVATDAQIAGSGDTHVVFAVGTSPTVASDASLPFPMDSVALALVPASAPTPSPSASASKPPPLPVLTTTVVLSSAGYPLGAAAVSSAALGIATATLDESARVVSSRPLRLPPRFRAQASRLAGVDVSLRFTFPRVSPSCVHSGPSYLTVLFCRTDRRRHCTHYRRVLCDCAHCACAATVALFCCRSCACP